MGGHGNQQHGNEHNLQETDAEMQTKIQRIDTIKHYPNHWHMEFFNAENMINVVGGTAALSYGAIGAGLSSAYYANKAAHMPRNFYAHNMYVSARGVFGFSLGLFAGYLQFGDRQRLHNAWVAERLRRRYPESMELHASDLWKLKGVKSSHEFYSW